VWYAHFVEPVLVGKKQELCGDEKVSITNEDGSKTEYD
jgi:hypothetical protein